MRDIRQDLQERVSRLKDQIAALKLDLSAKERYLASTEELLKRENEFWSSQEDFVFDADGRPNGEMPTLITFLRDTLSHGHSFTLDELKDEALARGFEFEGKSPGRAIHFRLLGLQRNHEAEKVGDHWRALDSS